MLKSDSTLELIKKKGKKKQLISCFVFFFFFFFSSASVIPTEVSVFWIEGLWALIHAVSGARRSPTEK